MSKYLTQGNIAAILAITAIFAGAFGKGALASFLNDPDTTQTILTVVGALGTLIAGASKGVRQ